MLKVGCVFWIATKQTETSWQAGEAVGKLGYSRLWELERSSLVWRRVGWDPTQGYKEWVVTAVEKCFWKSEKTDMLNPQEDRRMTQKNFALGASKPDFLSGNNHKNQVLRKEEISLAVIEKDPKAVFGWFRVVRGCSQASNGSIKAVQCPAVEVATQWCSPPLSVLSMDLDTLNPAQGGSVPLRKLLQRSVCWNWVPPFPPHHCLSETWSYSSALPCGAIQPSDSFGCR